MIPTLSIYKTAALCELYQCSIAELTQASQESVLQDSSIPYPQISRATQPSSNRL
jgi:hypothetical protein